MSTVTRKPKSERNHTPNEAEVERLIHKGGEVVDHALVDTATMVNLRLPTSLLKQVDRVVAARRVKIPRHTWLVEAIVEKLEREIT